MKYKQQATDRTVFEIVSPLHGVAQVEASQVTELAGHLQRLVPGLDAYTARGAAHLAFQERMNIQGKTWGVRRLGVLQFQADAEEGRGRPRSKRKAVPEAAATQPVSGNHRPPLEVPHLSGDLNAVQPLLLSQHGQDQEDLGGR